MRPLVLLVAVLVGACSPAVGELSAADAVECRELGAGLVHLRYETDDGPAVRNQHGIDHDRAQVAQGVSEEAARVLEALGWTEEALSELSRPEAPSPEVAALLEQRPSCLEELRAQQ